MIVSLPSIPDNLKITILKKLPNKELCRMRRTCTFLNQAVEEKKDEFANRNMPGAIMWIDGKSVSFASQSSSKVKTFRMDSVYLARKAFSAIVFSELHVTLEDYPLDDKYVNLKFMLEQLKKPSCEECFLPDRMNIEKTVETTNFITCRSMIHIKFRMFSDENIEDLQILARAQNSAKMNIRVKFPICRHFNTVKQFGHVQQEEQGLQKDFHDILWKLTETGDFGNLQQLSYECIDLEGITLPRTTSLWNSNSFPRDIISRNGGPDHIDHLELPNATHCAVISSHIYKDSPAPTSGKIIHATIFFIKKDSLSVLYHVASLMNRKTFSGMYYKLFASTEKDNWANFINTFFMETNQD